MNGSPSSGNGPPSAPRPGDVERWLRTAPPFLAARVRVLGTLYGLLRHAQQCRRDAERLRRLALRSTDFAKRRPCELCGGRGWRARVVRSDVEPSHPPLVRAWFSPVLHVREDVRRMTSAKQRDPWFAPVRVDCRACRAHRYALRAELAGAQWRAAELDAWASAVELLIVEAWPSFVAAIDRARRAEVEAERAEIKERAELGPHCCVRSLRGEDCEHW